MGKKLYSGFDCVDEFVPMANGGHCPMDQIEDTVNTELLRYLDTYFKAEKENKNMFPFFKQFANSN